jgi:AcrR family transcriptional regulator
VTPRFVNWWMASADEASGKEGLRERKKRLLRQQLSDTATELFLEHGFDDVRVTEIAEACGVSEKTVYNYFPTKESLILDRLQIAPAALLRNLADPAVPPLEAMLRILTDELASLTAWLAARADPVEASAAVRRFGDLIRATPSLRAYQRDMTDQLGAQVARVLAARMKLDAEDPEPQVAAAALLELWSVQFRSLRRHLATTHRPAEIHDLVTADVHRAARLIESGLGSVEALARRAPASPARGSSGPHTGAVAGHT